MQIAMRRHIDTQPKRELSEVQRTNGLDVQLEAVSTVLLGVASRRSDLIEALWDRSWVHDHAEFGVVLLPGPICAGTG